MRQLGQRIPKITKLGALHQLPRYYIKREFRVDRVMSHQLIIDCERKEWD